MRYEGVSMTMFSLNDLYVAYLEDSNGISHGEYTRVFTSKIEAELYQDAEKRENFMSYKILPMKEYLELIYTTGKEDGKDEINQRVWFHFG